MRNGVAAMLGERHTRPTSDVSLATRFRVSHPETALARDPIRPPLRSSSSGVLSYRKGPWESQLDHIAIRPPTDREWLARSTRYFPDVLRFTETELEAYLDSYSDHALVTAGFRTSLPDDD